MCNVQPCLSQLECLNNAVDSITDRCGMLD